MKNSTLKLLFMAVTFLAASTVFAQEGKTYTDDFGVAHDYLTSDVAGTIWEGILLNTGGNATETEAEITALNTTDKAGELSLTTINSAWDGGNDRGAALYRTVKGGADFEMQIKISGGDYLSLGATARLDYLMSGLIAKVKGDTTFVLIQAFDVSEWSAVIGMRDIDAAEGFAEENWKFEGLTLADFPYQKLEKYGETFTGYYSADGVAWEEIYSVEKPQFTGKDIQVGIYSATYTANEGHVIFDDFSMIDYNENVSANSIKSPSTLKAFYRNNSIVVDNGSRDVISSVKLIGIDGAVKFSKNVNSTSLSIPVSQKGMYVLVSEIGGKSYSQKIAAY